MGMKQCCWLLLTGLMSASLAGGVRAAEKPPAAKHGESSAAAWADLLGVVGKLPVSSLAGLIRPEKMEMEMASDNQCRIEDNEAHVLSDNDADVKLLSGNEARILSDIRILCGLTLEVNVTIHCGDGKAPAAKAKKAHRKAKKAHRTRKPRKPRKPRATPKPKQS